MMTEKEYCSTVCKAQCCRTRSPVIFPRQCPKLTADNLCSIYATRLGFRFPVITEDGQGGTCTCSMLSKVLPQLPPDVAAQCCVAHPELLCA